MIYRNKIGLWVVLAQLLWASTVAATNESPVDCVAQFKAYLSTPPCIERLLYRLNRKCDETREEQFVLAYARNGFFLRRIAAYDNIDSPISLANRMHSAILAGKSADLRWQINGFSVSKSISPDSERPDPIATASESVGLVAGGVVNLGPQEVLPGTFTWDGDSFQAEPTFFQYQLNPKLKKIFGNIVVENGRVVRMNIDKKSYTYDYAISTKRPTWFPSRVTMRVLDDCVRRYLMDEVEFGKLDEVSRQFLPEYHIVSEVALTTVISNGQVVISPNKTNADVIRLVSREHSAKQRPRVSKILARIGLGVVLCLPIIFFGYRSYSGRKPNRRV